ncbi:hypothetical protein Daesc_001592 [Daldinia eschscholtzii]|uniref:Uncharacterized protein n=1 Tax=Daldinia eschscholtzii TaxID=292717 RepID=A0AAX6MV92_9PEZI
MCARTSHGDNKDNNTDNSTDDNNLKDEKARPQDDKAEVRPSITSIRLFSLFVLILVLTHGSVYIPPKK